MVSSHQWRVAGGSSRCVIAWRLEWIHEWIHEWILSPIVAGRQPSGGLIGGADFSQLTSRLDLWLDELQRHAV